MILFRVVGAFFGLRLYRPLWGKIGALASPGGVEGVGGTIAAQSLTKRCNVEGRSEAWMKSLCHVSDMFREGKWKSLKFPRGFVADGENHHLRIGS